MDRHPAIQKQIDDLFKKAAEVISEQEEGIAVVKHEVSLKDTYGLKSRASQILSTANQLFGIAAQIRALSNLSYHIPPDATSEKCLKSSRKRKSNSRLPSEE